MSSSTPPGLRPFGLKHKAVALTLMGDLEGADAIYALPLETGFEPTRASVMAHLQVLCALGEYERASALLTDVFGGGCRRRGHPYPRGDCG